MKTVGLRSLYQVAPTLTEDVIVVHGRRIVGRYSPIPWTEELMTVEDVKKAIEPDQVKREPRGRMTKGLGEVPGLTQKDPYAEFRPAPKPTGKK